VENVEVCGGEHIAILDIRMLPASVKDNDTADRHELKQEKSKPF